MSERCIKTVDWDKALRFLSTAAASAPYAEEPEIVWHDHPDETWKNATELSSIEARHKEAVDSLISTYVENRTWPHGNDEIWWCIQQRFDFATDQVLKWASVPSPLVTGIWSDNKLPVVGFFKALLTEDYWRTKFPENEEL